MTTADGDDSSSESEVRTVGVVWSEVCTVGVVWSEVCTVGVVWSEVCTVGVVWSEVCTVGVVWSEVCTVGVVWSAVYIGKLLFQSLLKNESAATRSMIVSKQTVKKGRKRERKMAKALSLIEVRCGLISAHSCA